MNYWQRDRGIDAASVAAWQHLDNTGTFKEAVIGILAAVAKQERTD